MKNKVSRAKSNKTVTVKNEEMGTVAQRVIDSPEYNHLNTKGKGGGKRVVEALMELTAAGVIEWSAGDV